MEQLSVAESGEFVAKNAELVKIDPAGVEQCSEDIARQVSHEELVMKQMYIKTDVHPKTADESGIDWVFFVSTLNFCFWNPEDTPQYTVTYKGVNYNGYLAMCAAVNRTLDSGIKLTDPEFFVNLNTESLSCLLKGDNDVDIPLVEKRVECLQQVGKLLLAEYGGRFSGMLEKCQNSAERLVSLVITQFQCFNDTANFKGQNVAFHKRAQILVADLWCLFEGEGKGRFADIDKLTMFADYRVPQSLQKYGALRYDEKLLNFLKTDTIMESGHEYEIEIRGCSIHAVELITKRVRELLKEKKIDAEVNSILIDQYLWGYRRKHAEEMEKFPFHKVRSVFY